MPPKEATTGLSIREMQQIAMYLKCMKTKPEIDWVKYAELGNYGAMDSARASMGRLIKKIMADEGSTAGTPRKRKASTEDAVEGESPTKKATTKKAKTKRSKKDTKADTEPAEVDTAVKGEAGQEEE